MEHRPFLFLDSSRPAPAFRDLAGRHRRFARALRDALAAGPSDAVWPLVARIRRRVRVNTHLAQAADMLHGARQVLSKSGRPGERLLARVEDCLRDDDWLTGEVGSARDAGAQTVAEVWAHTDDTGVLLDLLNLGRGTLDSRAVEIGARRFGAWVAALGGTEWAQELHETLGADPHADLEPLRESFLRLDAELQATMRPDDYAYGNVVGRRLFRLASHASWTERLADLHFLVGDSRHWVGTDPAPDYAERLKSCLGAPFRV